MMVSIKVHLIKKLYQVSKREVKNMLIKKAQSRGSHPLWLMAI
jgi:hypothetical protein